jgi:hypothetical protein
MAATTQKDADKIQANFDPVTVVIRHGIFWYFAKEMVVQTDEKTKRLVEVETLVQRIANQNDEVTLVLESDYMRGVTHHAFWTDEEMEQVRALRNRESTHGVAAAAQEPLSVQAPSRDQLAAGDDDLGGGTDDQKEPLDFDLTQFEEHSDLVEWLQGSGTFDGMRAPNANEVIKAAGNNPDLAKRLLAAEPEARGDLGLRSTVENGLNKIIEAHA